MISAAKRVRWSARGSAARALVGARARGLVFHAADEGGSVTPGGQVVGGDAEALEVLLGQVDAPGQASG
jgi:hypothetical protein